MIKLIVLLSVSFFISASFSFTVTQYQALIPGMHPLRLTNHVVLFASENDGTNKEVQNKNDETVEWGVSYIGGDPCGSKYNTDPFDASAKITKPGMPDSMKARIAAKAEERLRQAEEVSKETDTNK